MNTNFIETSKNHIELMQKIKDGTASPSKSSVSTLYYTPSELSYTLEQFYSIGGDVVKAFVDIEVTEEDGETNHTIVSISLE